MCFDANAAHAIFHAFWPRVAMRNEYWQYDYSISPLTIRRGDQLRALALPMANYFAIYATTMRAGRRLMGDYPRALSWYDYFYARRYGRLC